MDEAERTERKEVPRTKWLDPATIEPGHLVAVVGGNFGPPDKDELHLDMIGLFLRYDASSRTLTIGEVIMRSTLAELTGEVPDEGSSSGSEHVLTNVRIITLRTDQKLTDDLDYLDEKRKSAS